MKAKKENKRQLRFWQKARDKARSYLQDPQKGIKVIEKAFSKSERVARGKEKLDETWQYFNHLIRMIKAYLRNEYRDIPQSTLIKSMAAAVYFVWVADFIPDFIVGFGFLDDITIIAWVVSSLKTDLDRFVKWEQELKG